MRSRHPHPPSRLLLAAAAGIALGVAGPSQVQAAAAGEPPPRLSATGLFAAGQPERLGPGIAPFSPQYPLWSDGADKRRWLQIPAGTAIDASKPDAWVFPIGTKLWKEFAHGGRPVETRYIERRRDGRWAFASYIWNADGRDAELAPAGGASLAIAAAPQGRYAVPSRTDCLACHDSAAVPVLGASALQLSPDRDPLGAHGTARQAGELDLPGLVARGWLRKLPPPLLARPPRIAADTPLERAALGYLHGNCGHCHNRSGRQVPVPLTLAQSASDARHSREASLHSVLDAPSRYRAGDLPAGTRAIVPGRARDSLLVRRMESRAAQTQMPPLGTTQTDREGLALVTRWIDSDLTPTHQETAP